MQSSQLSTVRSPAYPLMPSFGVTSDYVHLRQEGSSETLTSFLEPSRNVDATEPSRPADDSGSVDGIVLDFRPSKSVWSSIRRRSTIEKFLFVLAFVLFIILALLVVVVIKKSSKDYTGKCEIYFLLNLILGTGFIWLWSKFTDIRYFTVLKYDSCLVSGVSNI